MDPGRQGPRPLTPMNWEAASYLIVGDTIVRALASAWSVPLFTVQEKISFCGIVLLCSHALRYDLESLL
jgi:hypothetical protein